MFLPFCHTVGLQVDHRLELVCYSQPITLYCAPLPGTPSCSVLLSITLVDMKVLVLKKNLITVCFQDSFHTT